MARDARSTILNRRSIFFAFATLIAGLAGYLSFWPVPIDPASWSPPPAPSFESNSRLRAAIRLDVGGVGPEDVAVDRNGQIYGGLVDGRIVRLQPEGTNPTTFARTGGRPLGLHFDGDDNLIVADAVKGLLRIDPQGKISSLATEHGGVPFGFTDDVDIAPDGAIYFSDASSRWGVHHYREDLMEHRPYGRLLAYDPRTKKTRLVLDKLYFANGVAVSLDGSFVLVNETAREECRAKAGRGRLRRGQHFPVCDHRPVVALPLSASG